MREALKVSELGKGKQEKDNRKGKADKRLRISRSGKSMGKVSWQTVCKGLKGRVPPAGG
jgi:hypothetical protein